MHIGNCTRIALKNAGKNQEWLAQQLGIASQQGASWICRNQHANSARIEELAKIFGMPIEDFIALSPDPVEPDKAIGDGA